MRKHKKTCMLAISLMACFLSAYCISFTAGATEPTNYLSILVGYKGGPYVEKIVYSVDELQQKYSMVTVKYTFGTVADPNVAEQGKTVPVAQATGIPLATILQDTGIDLTQVADLAFNTDDKTGSHIQMSYAELCQTTRYFYPWLVACYDYNLGKVPDGLMAKAMSEAEAVPTILAFSCFFTRLPYDTSGGQKYDPDFTSQMDGSERLRLFFGQVDLTTNTTYGSAKWVKQIKVEYEGAPTMSAASDSSVNLGVGGKYQFKADIQVVDDALLAVYSDNIEWTSDDSAIVTVDKNGIVTAKNGGMTTIRARFPNGTETTFNVNVDAANADPDNPNSNPNSGNTDPDDSISNTGHDPSSDNSNSKKSTDDSDSSSEPNSSPLPDSTAAGGDSGDGRGGPGDGNTDNEDKLSRGDVYSVALGKGLTELADKMGMILGNVQAAGSNGGGEKWKMYELSNNEAIIPEIEIESSPYVAATIAGTASLFGLGILGTILRFYWLK